MTIEELKEHCVRQITEFERIKGIMPVTPNGYKRYEEHKMVLKLIEAWEKVEKEINESILICRESAQNNIWYDGELTGNIYICYGREKVDVTEQAVKMVKAVWCMEHLEDFKKEIDEKSEMHSDGEFYIKNLDVKRIIDKHLSELVGDIDES